MNLEEWTQTMQQLVRERAALNDTYVALQEEARNSAEETQRTGIPKGDEEDLIRELVQVCLKLGNFLNIEREHANKLYALLVDSLKRLAECYEIPLPPDWPNK